MRHGLYVNKVGCYLHDANKPTSKTENINRQTRKKRNLLKVDELSVVDKLKYDV